MARHHLTRKGAVELPSPCVSYANFISWNSFVASEKSAELADSPRIACRASAATAHSTDASGLPKAELTAYSIATSAQVLPACEASPLIEGDLAGSNRVNSSQCEGRSLPNGTRSCGAEPALGFDCSASHRSSVVLSSATSSCSGTIDTAVVPSRSSHTVNAVAALTACGCAPANRSTEVTADFVSCRVGCHE